MFSTRELASAVCLVALVACDGDKTTPGSETPDATPQDATTEGGDAAAAVDASMPDAGGDDAATEAGGPDVAVDANVPQGSFCSLPGSVVWTDQGPARVPGGDGGAPDIGWMKLPSGFCAHYFATVPTVRQLRFAPSGELFAASPTQPTTGYGGGHGLPGVIVLPDDDHDGNADANLVFLNQLPAVQAIMFAGGYFYYQDNTIIRRVPYSTGDRQPSGPSEMVTDMGIWPQASEHWPRVLDQAQDGTIYVTNGSTQGQVCMSDLPVFGGIFQLMANGSTANVAKGFRNPIAMRCESSHNVCLAIELALDYSNQMSGREKLLPVRPGDDWGFPCCATQGTPYGGVIYTDTGATPNCGGVAAESDGFIIGHTPFGLDFETGNWPSPWGGRVFVTLHGVVASWQGARVVGIALDANGLPLPASEITPDAGAPDAMLDFATGWDDGRQDHGRPAPITFSADGRMFIGNDNNGQIIWVAPIGLMQQ